MCSEVLEYDSIYVLVKDVRDRLVARLITEYDYLNERELNRIDRLIRLLNEVLRLLKEH